MSSFRASNQPLISRSGRPSNQGKIAAHGSYRGACIGIEIGEQTEKPLQNMGEQHWADTSQAFLVDEHVHLHSAAETGSWSPLDAGHSAVKVDGRYRLHNPTRLIPVVGIVQAEYLPQRLGAVMLVDQCQVVERQVGNQSPMPLVAIVWSQCGGGRSNAFHVGRCPTLDHFQCWLPGSERQLGNSVSIETSCLDIQRPTCFRGRIAVQVHHGNVDFGTSIIVRRRTEGSFTFDTPIPLSVIFGRMLGAKEGQEFPFLAA